MFVEAGLGEEATALSDAEYGVLSLAHREPFEGRCVALWLGVQSLAFTLVCQPHENLLLAEGTLRNLTRHCLEELRLLGPGSEVRVCWSVTNTNVITNCLGKKTPV